MTLTSEFITGSEEAQSDSSSSPLYFQDKDEENCISQQDVSRNAGLALRRSSSIS